MEIKTYSRGRSAVAAAKKALAYLDAFITDISPAAHGDKFTAIVTVKPSGGKEIVEAVMVAGFGAVIAKGADKEIEDLSSDEEGEPSEAEELIEDEGGDPLPTDAPRKKGGYINEHSNVIGACALACAIARSMPDAPRKEVIAACRQAGIAYGTARTQLQRVRGGK